MSLNVLRSGLLTTLQDLGRYGYQQYGVIVSGVMDSFSHRVANILVGNQAQEASLEITMLGPLLQFDVDTVFAICGADLGPTIEGVAVPLWKTNFAKKGTKLSFKGGKEGCRAYLAVAGGFNVEKALGSKSTYLRAGLGGFKGRALEKGDYIGFGNPTELSVRIKKQLAIAEPHKPFVCYAWGITTTMRPYYGSAEILVRVTTGKEADLFTEDSIETLLNSEYLITNQSDRMGYRLEGARLSLKEPLNMISEAVTFGTVQVPTDGNPIILMADRQTTGGYPKIAQIISVDLPLLAQARPGAKIHFKEITMSEAQALYLQREKDLQQISLSVKLRIEQGGVNQCIK